MWSFKNIKADVIEEPVMNDIFDLFGDRKRIEQTMRTAATDLDKAKKLLSKYFD